MSQICYCEHILYNGSERKFHRREKVETFESNEGNFQQRTKPTVFLGR